MLSMGHGADYALKRIAELTSGTGTSFEIADVRSLSGPIVYILSDNIGPIYIGMSRNGIGRPFSSRHPMFERECTSLKVYPCKSLEAARQAEKILIALFQPRHNRALRRSFLRELLGVVQ